MPTFYALVDAVPGRAPEVEAALEKVQGLEAFTRCREKDYDFLVRFQAPGFDVVDDYLQTHVRRLPGVKGIEIVERWDEYSAAVAEARARLDA